MERVADAKRRAQSLIQSGQWEEAIRAYERIADSSEPDPFLQVLIGDVQLKRGQIPLAVEAYQRAVDGYRDTGLLKNAIALCKKILRLNHNRAGALAMLAELNALDGLVGEAAVCYISAADAAIASGSADIAIAHLGSGVNVAPTHTECSRKLVDLLKQHGRAPEAAAELVRLAHAVHMSGREKDAAAFVTEARALHAAVDVPDFDAEVARKDDSAIVSLDLESTRRVAHAPPAADSGDSPDGLETTRLDRPAPARAAAPSPAPAPAAPAEAEAPSNGTHAGAHAEPAPATDLKSVSSLVIKGDHSTGVPLVDLSDILQEFKESLDTQLAADDSKSHFDMAMAYMEMNLWGDAVAEFAAASRDAEMRPMCYEMLGQCYLKQEKPEDALRFLTLGIECPDLRQEAELSMRYYLALALAELGRDDEACSRLEEVIRARPDFLDSRSRLEGLRLRRAS